MFDGGVKRTFWAGPWKMCMICDRKTKIADMRWQRGLLKCDRCFDEWPLLGQREVGIEYVLNDGKEELAPVDKLRNPSMYEEAEDFSI
jgi:hypothetical protein